MDCQGFSRDSGEANIRIGAHMRWKRVMSSTGPTPIPRHGHRAVAIKDLIIIFGGGNDGIVADLHVYNTATNQWLVPAVSGDVPPGCAAFGMACNGTIIYIFGGVLEHSRYSEDLYELQTVCWKWKKLSPRAPEDGNPPPCARLGHTFCIDSLKVCYLFGGLANNSALPKVNVPKYLNDLYMLDLSDATNSLQWICPETYGTPPSPRESHSAVIYERVDLRRMLVFGGMNGARLGDLYMLDLHTMTWTQPELRGIPPLPRSLHSANVVDDRMIVFGGWVPLGTSGSVTNAEKEWKCTNSLCSLDLKTWTWENQSMEVFEDAVPKARAGHSAVLVNKRIYVWSGRDGYRKTWDSQVCCKDMWHLETAKPERVGRIQLYRASMNHFEVFWKPVDTADAYLIQLRKLERLHKSPECVYRSVESVGAAAKATPPGEVRPSAGQAIRVLQQTPRTVLTRAHTGEQYVRFLPSQRATTSGSSLKPYTTKAIIVRKGPQRDSTPTKLVLVQPISLRGSKQGTIKKVPYDMAQVRPTQAAIVIPKPQISTEFTPSISTQGTTYTSPTTSNLDVSLPQNLLDEVTPEAEVAVGHRFETTDHSRSGAGAVNRRSEQSSTKSLLAAQGNIADNDATDANFAQTQQYAVQKITAVDGTGQAVVKPGLGIAEESNLLSNSEDKQRRGISKVGEKATEFDDDDAGRLDAIVNQVAESEAKTSLNDIETLNADSHQAQSVITEASEPFEVLESGIEGENVGKEVNSAKIAKEADDEKADDGEIGEKSAVIGGKGTKGKKYEVSPPPGERCKEDVNHGTPPPVLSPAEPLIGAAEAKTSKFSGGRRVALNLATSSTKSRFVEGRLHRAEDEFLSIFEESGGVQTIRTATPSSQLMEVRVSHWHDVAISKKTVFSITHYFISSEFSLENAYGHQTNIPVLEKCMKIVKLEPGCVYNVRVAGLNACGRGEWSPIATFKTCLPGFPGAPSNIRIARTGDGAYLAWSAPKSAGSGVVSEYSVYLAVNSASDGDHPVFVRVYSGHDTYCTLPAEHLQYAFVDTVEKPAIILRVAARNEKGYGPATQVRWLQDRSSPYPSVSGMVCQQTGYEARPAKRGRFE